MPGPHTFRGLIAPASLKHNAMAALSDAMDDLPGPNRPGLIEALSPRARHGPLPSLPGPNRPGLIEAWTPRRNRWPARTLPGPNRPGLIEATVTCAVNAMLLPAPSGA